MEPQTPPPATPSHAHAVVRGISWNTAGIIVQTMLAMAALVVVSRQLTPRDFAVGGLALTIASVLAILATASFGPAIVQRASLSRPACDSIFWTCCAIAVAVVGGIAATAPLFARLYHEAQLPAPLIAASVGVALMTAGVVPTALLQRQMKFRELNLARTAGVAASSVAAVVLAAGGYGYWAVVIPYPVLQLVTASAAFAFARYVPHLRYHFEEVKSHSAFAGAMAVYAMAFDLGARADYLTMSRVWSSTQFGLYYFARERSRYLLTMLVSQAGGTLMPAISRMQDDLVRVRNAFLQATRAWCAIVYPLHVLLIGLADPAVPLIFGEQWRTAVPILQVFVVSTLAGTAWAMASDVLPAVGRPKFNAAFSLLQLATIVPLLFVLMRLRATPFETAVAITILMALLAPFWGVLLRRAIALTWREHWVALRRIVLASVTMALVLIAVKLLCRAAGLGDIVTLIVTLIAASAVYAAITRETLLELLRTVRHAVSEST